jgi:hypothetical protein
MEFLEKQMVTVLDQWTNSFRAGQWAKSQVGIGPILAAGVNAHINIEKAPTVGHIWRFAGLDPNTIWMSRENAAKMVKDVELTEENVRALAVTSNLNQETVWRFASTNREGEQQDPTAKSVAAAL